MRSVVFILALFLVGCAPPQKYWVHNDKNKTGFLQDQGQCKYDIGLTSAQKTIPPHEKDELLNNCLYGKGWRVEEKR